MSTPPPPRPRSTPAPTLPWWLGRGAGLTLLAAAVAAGWTFAWTVAEQVDGPARASVTTAPVALHAEGAAPQPSPAAPSNVAEPTGATEATEATGGRRAAVGPERTMSPAEIRRREEALVRRALRRDRELAAFIEAAGVAEELWVPPIGVPYRITATFGQAGSLWRADHTGVDLAAPTGTPVSPVAAGTVTFAGDAGAYGSKVEIAHPDGIETSYAHLSRIDVFVGQVLDHGAVLGAVGSTGNSTGPHLHLELRTPTGVAVDPVKALAARGVTL